MPSSGEQAYPTDSAYVVINYLGEPSERDMRRSRQADDTGPGGMLWL